MVASSKRLQNTFNPSVLIRQQQQHAASQYIQNQHRIHQTCVDKDTIKTASKEEEALIWHFTTSTQQITVTCASMMFHRTHTINWKDHAPNDLNHARTVSVLYL
eukprot:888865_1